MAEASELLKRVMDAHPEIKRLAAQKAAMHDALADKGFGEDRLTDMREYGELIAALDFSIDNTIEENGFTHDFGDGLTLSSALADLLDGQRKLADYTEYKSGDFKGDLDLLYLTKKPVKAGSLSNFCNGALNLLYIPQLDFSGVTDFDATLYQNLKNPLKYVHDTYEIDCSSLSSWRTGTFDFMRNLVLKNMGGSVSFYQSFANCDNLESLVGLDLSNMKSTAWFLWGTRKPCAHIEFADGSYIRYGNVLSGLTTSRMDVPFVPFDNMDNETLRDMCEHAYDWKTNPDNLTDVEYAIQDDGTKTYNYKSYFFSDAAKARLASAYPSIDFKKMMEDKGWTW